MNLKTDFHQRVLPVCDKLYRFSYRLLGNVEEAEDVVQEVLLKVWNKRHEMHTYLNMEAWCMRLTKNLSLDKLRVRKQFVDTEYLDRSSILSPESPMEQLVLEDAVDLVHQIIATLPENQKVVIQLRDIEGYSYQEIADISEMTLDQVKVNLHRARKTIKAQLTRLENHGLQ